MSDAANITLSEALRGLAQWYRLSQIGVVEMTKDGASAFLATLDMAAVECQSLEQQLAVARRWARGGDFVEGFARDKAILAGVRAGRVVDLVPVLEREMARDAAMREGSA